MSGEIKGRCEHCNTEFGYRLVHNGFADSAYAYCEFCGMTALFDGWSPALPKGAPLKLHQPITPEVEPLVQVCECGGHFRGNAAPRCPQCRSALSPELAAQYIERNAPGTKVGWAWQRTWNGIYAIIVDGKLAKDPWRGNAG